MSKQLDAFLKTHCEFLWVLDSNKVPRRAENFNEWADWMMRNDRVIGYTQRSSVTVSTVFLGVAFVSPLAKEPYLFESMVFGGPDNNFVRRYRTWDEAARGHEQVCIKAKVKRRKRKQPDG